MVCLFNKYIKIAGGAERLSMTAVDLRISVSLGVFSRSLYSLYFLRHLGCLFLSCSLYRLAAALPWAYLPVPSKEFRVFVLAQKRRNADKSTAG